MNFAKKQSDNLEQQETSPNCSIQSPLEHILSLLRPRAAPTELRALVVEEPEDLETDDEGLISFEEERVSGTLEHLQLPSPDIPRSFPRAEHCPLLHVPVQGRVNAELSGMTGSPWALPCSGE